MEAQTYHDEELGEVSWEKVCQVYRELGNINHEVSKEANSWLVKFYKSKHALPISLELLEFGSSSDQMLGVTILDKQIKHMEDRVWESIIYELGTVTSKLELVEFLLTKLEKTSGNVRERLLVCIAVFGVYNVEIDQMVKLIIQYGSEDTEKWQSSLGILSNIPQELEYLAGDIPLRNKKKFDLLNQCDKVYEYLVLILNSESMPDKIYELCFKTIETWTIKSDRIYNNEQILEIVFNAAKTQKWFKWAKDIMSQAICCSSNTKLFFNVQFKEAFNQISPQEKKFLDSVLDFILQGKDKFEAELEDLESEYCKEISELASDLIQNFEILLFDSPEKTNKILDYICLILKHDSRVISLKGLEVFTELKETLQELKSDVVVEDHLIDPFFTASQIVLEKCKKKLLVQLSDGSYEEPEDTDIEGQENWAKYREYASDLFFSTYYIGGLIKGREYKNIFENMLLERFKMNDQTEEEYAKTIEVVLFAAKSSIDAVELPNSEYPDLNTGQIDLLIDKIWTALLEIKEFKEPTMFWTALHFMNEGSIYLPYKNELLKESLEYIFEGFGLYHKISTIQGAVFRWLIEIAQNGSSIFNEGTFELFLSFVEQNASVINKDNWSNAMEGLWSICSAVPEEKIPEVMHRILKCATEIFPQIEFSDPNHRLVLIKSLLMLSGAIKILSRFNDEVIKETLGPILDTFLEKIGEALQYYCNDTEVYLTICSFYSRCIKAMGPQFSVYFKKVVTDCFNCFDKNKEDSKVIDVCNLALSLTVKTPEIEKFMFENFNGLVGWILGKIDGKDTDHIKSFAQFCYMTSKKISPEPMLSWPDLEQTITLFCEFMKNIVEKEANNEIIFFFHEFVWSEHPDVQSAISKYVEYIGDAFLTAVPKIGEFASVKQK
jgi:hypothetical protein